MSTVHEIENAVRRLPPDDLAAFRAWFAEFDAEVWNRQLDEDVAAGRLDTLACLRPRGLSMALDTSSLRTPDDSFPPVKDRTVTLMRVANGGVTQASTVTDKREMLR
jgi:hypothetical protein